MNRRDFGLWGRELASPDFAQALAALGVFQNTIEGWPPTIDVGTISRALSKEAARSRGLLGWRLSVLPPAELHLKTPRTAQLFAQAWKKFAAPHKRIRRLELHLDRMEDYFWTAGQLLSPAVKASSLYVRADQPRTDVGWNWPLRLGFLKGDESQGLRKQLEQRFKTSSLKRVIEYVDIINEGDDCDLLLLPQSLRGALSEMLQATWRPRADCVLVLGGSRDLSERMTAMLHAVRTQARTSGVGLLFIASERRGEWLYGLVTELSHNIPLDVALFNVNRASTSAIPLLAASRSLIDLTLVSRSAARLGQTLKSRVAATSLRPGPRRSLGIGPPMLPGGGKYGGGGGGGGWGSQRKRAPRRFLFGKKKNGGGGIPRATRSTALKVARSLERVSDWRSESLGATTVVEHSRAAKSLIKEIPRKSENRRIQAQVFDSLNGKQQRGALKPDASYAVDVRIGPPNAKWESAGKAFPVEKLPPSETGHDLTVVFSEPRVSPDPQVGKLFLPPSGATAPCRFYFHLNEALDRVRARITVLHRNRVIQTAILDAPVGIAKTKKEAITLEIEARVLPDINDLARRQSFDTALVLNHADDGKSYAMAVSGEQADMFSFDAASFKQTIDTLNGELSNLADNPDDFPKDIGAKPTTELLTMLAQHGRLLYMHLFKFSPEGREWLVGKEKKKIQIVSTRPESNLPLEFLYDYDAPEDNAKLCAFAKESLPKGECDKACRGVTNNKKVICPLGFWGLNRIIERHARGEKPPTVGTHGMKAASSSERQPLQVLDRALFAASDKVDEAKKGTIKGVEKVLKEKTRHTDYVTSWKGWAAKIKTKSPSLLLLLSHTEVAEMKNKMPALEISKLERLSLIHITKEYVRKDGSETRPLVMLVGCSTHAPDNPLQSFVPFFGEYASIVLSTGATVLALQAAEVATEFVRTLSRLSGKEGGTTFGDVMLDVRRRLLAKGLPMVLCLSAYGDADWRLK